MEGGSCEVHLVLWGSTCSFGVFDGGGSSGVLRGGGGGGGCRKKPENIVAPVYI
jgi:hypothetical protein